MGKERLRDFMRTYKISRKQVADGTGVSVQTVTHWTNRSEGIGFPAVAPNRVNAKKLQKFLSEYDKSIDIDDFFYTD